MDTGVDASNEGDASLSVQLEVFVRSLTHLQEQLEGPLQLQPKEQQQPVIASDVADNAADVNQLLLQLQRQFQAIVSIAGDIDIDPKAEQSVSQSFVTYQTETHRRLRLMAVEAMRLRTARQPQTIERVCAQLNGHLAQVQQFAQAMVCEVSEREVSEREVSEG